MQSDGYQSGYFHKMWVKYYCLGENQASQNLLGIKVHTSCKISKFCRYFEAKKIHLDKIFGIWIFFNWKDKVIDITREKIKWGSHIFIHKSYNEIIHKILRPRAINYSFMVIYERKYERGMRSLIIFQKFQNLKIHYETFKLSFVFVWCATAKV